MFVIPNVEVVLIPERDMAQLPQEGAEVPDTLYWRKRLAVGDVREGQPQFVSKKEESEALE